jgi:HK97 gp10 family phage protein
MAISIRIRNLENEFDRINREVMKKMDEELAKKTDNLIDKLKEATPVDTGLARASWVLVKNLSREKRYTIMNNVPYIEQLNNGSSKQAPKHFIEMTALAAGGTPVGTIVQVTES